jgi:hypothetical protein
MKMRLVYIVLIVLLMCLPTFVHAALPVSFLSKARLGVLCSKTANTNAALDCWLRENPNVAGVMFYEDSTYLGTWTTGPLAVEDQFLQYFNLMVPWYDAGMPPSTYPQLFPVQIPEQGPPDPVNGFWMSEAMGTQVYLSQVANSLAAELTAAFS